MLLWLPRKLLKIGTLVKQKGRLSSLTLKKAFDKLIGIILIEIWNWRGLATNGDSGLEIVSHQQTSPSLLMENLEGNLKQPGASTRWPLSLCSSSSSLLIVLAESSHWWAKKVSFLATKCLDHPSTSTTSSFPTTLFFSPPTMRGS